MVQHDGYITRREAAARAGVHENSIRNWEERGILKTREVPRGTQHIVLIEAESLDAHIRERQAAQTSMSDSDRLAMVEAENRELRNRLEACETERRQLLEELLRELRGGREGQD